MDLKSLVRPVARIGTFLVITVTASANSVAGQHNEFQADLFPTPPGGMAVSDFVARETPGNVGVALSGGGSRALSAGMGQLRALKYLINSDLALLEQTKALSTVSGGSWVGVPFSYLGNSAVSDDDYLNLYVEDPSDLVPTSTPGHTLAETLDEMPAGNIGANINRAFSPAAIALQALWFRLYGRVPPYMLWQTVIGLHLLSPYGLFLHGRNLAPIDSYSYDQTTLEDLFDLPGQDPDLAGIPVHLLNGAPSRLTRPYQICNTSMFLKTTDSNNWHDRARFEFLAPVQSTPFFTGILGSPQGFDINGQQPGGGGLSSFAFNSRLLALDDDPGDTATIGMPRTSSSLALPIENHRPFSLMDAVGASSAFYASYLQNLFASWQEDSRLYLDALDQHGEESLRWASRYLTKDATDRIRKELDVAAIVRTKSLSTNRLTERLEILGQSLAPLQDDFDELGIKNLVPAYRYWPITDADPQVLTRIDRFADGGDLENTGVNALLSYADIDTIIAFVNSVTALQPSNGEEAQLSVDGAHTIHTNILVDSQIPPLFGYQPFDDTSGTYVLYEGAANPDYPQGMHSQSFRGEDFPEFLLGLWDASGDGRTSCPNFLQEGLSVETNEWFGIPDRGKVSVLWVYTNFSQTWFDELSSDVQQLFQSEELEDFPHYSTLDTELNPTQVNLLANLAAWCVADDQNRDAFVDLYEQIP